MDDDDRERDTVPDGFPVPMCAAGRAWEKRARRAEAMLRILMPWMVEAEATLAEADRYVGGE